MMKSLIATATAAMALASPAYSTGWYVYTEASANALSEPANTIQSSSDKECNGSADGNGGTCSAAAGYVGRHSFSKTSAQAVASATGLITTYGSVDGPTSGHGFAYADLATGEIGINTSAASNYHVEHTSGGARADLVDTLHFISADITPVVMRVHLDGVVSGNEQPSFSVLMGDSLTTLATGGRWADGNSSYIDLSSPTVIFNEFLHYGTWTTLGPKDFVGTFLVDPRHPEVYIAMSLSAGGNVEQGPLFANLPRAKLSLSLADGVRFSSDSGVFPGSTPAAVPEPEMWSLLVIGFGTIGLAVRRRTAAVAS